MKFEAPRVRIAPSPTGDPHVGLAYVTLFNYAFVKRHGGRLILRIEDTDQERSKASSETLIMESLKWLGLPWDEGPDIGGPCGPYKQSERKEIYREYTQRLVDMGQAYPCFCSAKRLDVLRNDQKRQGQTTGYDRLCRALPAIEAQAQVAAGVSHVIRLKMPTEGILHFHDLLRGSLEFEATRFDDQVLMKSDGFPTYHLANVVDDHAMGITHVIRAEEWISSTPKHRVLYEAFGWELPTFVHLPLLRNHDRSKISKRKNSVSLNYYRRKGILPKAMLNFLGLMGWSYGEDVEKFTLEQMIPRFDLKDIHLGGPVFDLKKLTWLNQKYIQELSQAEFVDHLQTEVFSGDYLKSLYPLIKDRLDAFEDVTARHSYFFTGSLDYKGLDLVPKGMDPQVFCNGIEALLEDLDQLYIWTAKELETVMEARRQALGWKPKELFMSLRLMTTGRMDSPPLAETLAVLGREMVRHRLRDVCQSLH